MNNKSKLNPYDLVLITKRSFTLIELMLVVIIIGVLAAMVMPRLVGRSEQARIAAAKADITTIGLALDLFETDIGHYPSSLDELMTVGSNSATAWKGPYLKKTPIDPWGKPYEYKLITGSDYQLCSKGTDQSNNSDDICNS